MEEIYKEVSSQLDTLNIKTGFVLGLSGGIDSMALLKILNRYCQEKGKTLILVHLNHNLRGKESDADEGFCKQIANNLKLKIFTKQLHLNKKGNIENQAREERYSYFEEIRQTNNLDYILTGHHQDDNIETILFNFIRGAFTYGLNGLQFQNNYIVRPLLTFKKEQLKLIVDEYIEDETNFENNYSRNILRNKAIPILKEINPQLEKTILNFSNNFQLMLESNKRNINNIEILNNSFSNNQYNELDTFQQNLFLVELYKSYYSNTQNLTSKQIEEWRNIINNNKTGKMKTFGSCLILTIHNKHTFITPPNKVNPPKSKEFLINEECQFGEYNIIIKKSPNENAKFLVRSKKAGDKIMHNNQTKKIKDILINNKVKQEDKSLIPIIEDITNSTGKIIAIGNFNINSEYQITIKKHIKT